MMDISPTCFGYIDDEDDLALVFQGVFDGNLRCIERRPYEAEKVELVSSGNIFVFNEERSGIKRWTDGFSWSPSRISGKFLVYREYNRLGSTQDPVLHNILEYNIFERAHRKYFYTGLLKKTFSLKFNTDPTDSTKLETFHLIAYYTEKDIRQGSLKRPSENPFFNKFRPSQKLSEALQKVAVGNGRSNPSKNNERGRTKAHNSKMCRSLSSSSSYCDLLKYCNTPGNVPVRSSLSDSRTMVQIPLNTLNITPGEMHQQQHQQQQQYLLPIDQQNQLPLPYVQHQPQPIGIYNPNYQPGLRRTVSQPMIFCNTYNTLSRQHTAASYEGCGVTPPLVYSSNTLNALPYQNLDPYCSRPGPECNRSQAPIASTMIHPVRPILVHDYRQGKPIASSMKPPNVNITTSTNKNLDGIYILPAPRMNLPPQTQYQMIHTPDSVQHGSTFSENNTSSDQKSHKYPK